MVRGFSRRRRPGRGPRRHGLEKRQGGISPRKFPPVFSIPSVNDLRERWFLRLHRDGVAKPSEIRNFGQASRRARDRGFPIRFHIGAYATCTAVSKSKAIYVAREWTLNH